MDPDTMLEVSTSDPTPPFEQLRRQLVELISSGRVEGGQRLPPVRQLAADLGLAAGTVARTYRELETAGLVVTRRGGGTRVSSDLSVQPAAVSDSDLHRRMAALVRQSRRLGATDRQIRDALDTALNHAPGTPPQPQPADDRP
jgi:DNA-binding transcriptional regulator YhcF (GntR family)